MPFDGVITRTICNELNEKILNGKIEKIYQPQNDEILLYIHNNTKHKLILCSNAQNARLNLTNIVKENPAKAPNFCLLLRKYLQNGRIKKINQVGFDRIVELHIESPNEIGDITTKILIIEIMGKHSNIILLNSERKIIDSIKHIDFETSRLREILPGRPYEYPNTQQKLNPLEYCNEFSKFTDIFLECKNNNDFAKKLVDSFSGISPYIANKILEDCSNNTTKILTNFFNFINNINTNPQKGILIFNDDKLKDFYISTSINTKETYNSINETVDSFISLKITNNKFLNFQSDLLKITNQHLSKIQKKLNIQLENIKKCENLDKFKLYGELLTSNLYKISFGSSIAKVNNYYEESNPIIEITLDSSISPAQNAQKYFIKYNKLKSTMNSATQQIEQFEKEIQYLETIISQIEICKSIEDLDEIKDELISQNLIVNKNNSNKKTTTLEPYKYKSTDDFEIFVGKNNKQNDYLSLKFAKPNDIWLHVQKIPSSHVIIKTSNGNVSDNALLYAAKLCAYYSRARLSKNVSVDYTFAKNVNKPKGSKPGFVIYTNFKTIIVNP